jgi:hypothetical protein
MASALLVVILTGCGPVSTAGAPELVGDEGCADVIRADVETSYNGTHTFTVTVASDDHGWDKYADAWIVRVDGVEIGRRELTHPHADEQPFTRSLSGVVVPDGATVAVITANDSVLGECGKPLELSLLTP